MIKYSVPLVFLVLLLSGCASSSISKLPEICHKKGETGKCRAYFLKYHYNSKKNQCESYVYGGCGEIVFDTLEACQKQCEN